MHKNDSKIDYLDEKISKYYDGQMEDSELINFEADMALSGEKKEYIADKCYKYFKISNSIKLTKYRMSNLSKLQTDTFLSKEGLVLINVNAVGFKSFYKHFRNMFLSFLRYNP